MLSATDAFLGTTPADQRHTPVVGESHFSDIDEDDQEGDAASQSSDVDVNDGANARAAGVSVAHATYDDAAVGTTAADVAVPTVDIGDVFGAPVTRPSVAQMADAQRSGD